jgi:hypothetical protein
MKNEPHHSKATGQEAALSAFRRCDQFAYWAALLAVLIWAARLRFQWPPDPVADGDIGGYLLSGIGKLLGNGFIHVRRNFVYPGWLYLLLRCFSDFRAITIAQHALGLVAGVLFLATWCEIRKFYRAPRIPYSLYRWLGLLVAAIYLFALEPIRLEGELRPEGLCGFLVILSIFLVVRFTWRSLARPHPKIAVSCGSALIFTATLLVFVKPSMGLAAAGAFVPVALALLWRRDARATICLGAAAGATALLLVVPESLLARGDETQITFLPTDLFMIHAAQIRDQMADDLAANLSDVPSRSWLSRISNSLATEIDKAAAFNGKNYPTLGFDPDYLMYRDGSTDFQLREEFHGNIEALCAFYRDYYWRTWRQHPVRMLDKIGRQLRTFYGPICPAYNAVQKFPMADDYAASAVALGTPDWFAVWSRYAPAMELINRTTELATSGPTLLQSKHLRRCLSCLAVTYRWVLFASMGSGLVILGVSSLRSRWCWIVALVLFLFWYNFGSCLEVAVLHTLDVVRYRTVQLIFTLLAQATAILLLVELVLDALSRASRRGW